MIAPAYTALAAEYAGRAVFLKVDTNRNWETAQVCQISAMPTFQFYLNGERVQQFQGADSNGLRRYTEGVVRMAEQAGTYVGVEVTTAVMEDFYRTHPPGMNATAASIALKYKGKTNKLMKLLRDKYNEAPTPAEKKRKPRTRSKVQATAIGKASTEELQEELTRRKEEDAAYMEDVFSDPAALSATPVPLTSI
jgi:thioredoxin-like negative regulator of GroEL